MFIESISYICFFSNYDYFCAFFAITSLYSITYRYYSLQETSKTFQKINWHIKKIHIKCPLLLFLGAKKQNWIHGIFYINIIWFDLRNA